MRLWHYKLIPYLPRTQLIAQWRELNSIFKKEDKHILINYIYDYEKIDLHEYSLMVIKEMTRRGYNFKLDNYFAYFKNWLFVKGGRGMYHPFVEHHTYEYLLQCFFNLQEKYQRGQKDFSKEEYIELEGFINYQLSSILDKIKEVM